MKLNNLNFNNGSVLIDKVSQEVINRAGNVIDNMKDTLGDIESDIINNNKKNKCKVLNEEYQELAKDIIAIKELLQVYKNYNHGLNKQNTFYDNLKELNDLERENGRK
jgi:hypothetical protein